MIEEQGRVVKVVGGRAEVEVVPSGACSHCGAAGICNWTGKKEKIVEARNPVGAKPGETVVLGRSGKVGAGSALLVFGLPALLLVAGVVLGSLLLNERWAGILAAAGLGLGVAVVLLVNRSAARSGRGLPEILRIVAEGCKGDDDETVADRGDGDSGAGAGKG